MKHQFAAHIKAHFPDLLARRVLIAISGGVDSVVLAYLLQEMGVELGLAHCNFQLRGAESDGDEVFVRALAEKFDVPVYVERFNTRAMAGENRSIQLVARDLRYRWFEELRARENYDFVLTAHHLNDEVETFFINLIRGTGIEGLSGIPRRHKTLVRPLLDFSRPQILHFALQENLHWREDRSNATDDYLRNRIRHHIIPLFLQEEPDFLERFRNTRENLRESVGLLEEYTTALNAKIRHQEKGFYYYKIDKIQAYKYPRAVLYRLFHHYGFKAWEDIWSLLTAQSGKVVYSPSHRLLKDRDYLILDKQKEQNKAVYLLHKNDRKLTFENGLLICENVIKVTEIAKNIAYLAAEKLVFPLKLRRWESGDHFRPLGMRGRKKISDFLNDEKISLFEKERTWVLVSDDTLVWVVGHRISDQYKIQEKTQEILKIEWKV